MIKKFYTWNEFDKDIIKIINWLKEDKQCHITKIYGIPKGGLITSVSVANYLQNITYIHNLKDVDEYTLIVDDISDTGKTLLKIPNILNYKTLTLFCKEETNFQPTKWLNTVNKNEWVVFPWEQSNKEEKKDETKLY